MTALVLVLVIFSRNFAEIEAMSDAVRIRAGEDINHYVEWIQRATIATLVVGVFLGAFHMLDHPVWWCLVPLLLMMAAVFSRRFRPELNRLRKKNPEYMSRSNHYDSFWIRRYGVDAAGMMASRVELMVSVFCGCVAVAVATFAE